MPTSLGSLVAGAFLGGVSGILLVALGAGTLAERVPSIWPVGIFAAGWVVSAWFLSRRTTRVSVVLRRGFALGAAEWLLLVLLDRAVPAASALAGRAGAANRSDSTVLDVLSGSLGTVMLWVCVLGFLAFWWGTRVRRAER
jgi:hypothetical protein